MFVDMAPSFLRTLFVFRIRASAPGVVENLNATVSKSVEITWLHFINRCTMLADPVLASSFSGHFRWHYEANFCLISVHFMRHHHWPFGPLLLELNLLPFVTDRHCAWLISSASDSPRVVFARYSFGTRILRGTRSVLPRSGMANRILRGTRSVFPRSGTTDRTFRGTHSVFPRSGTADRILRGAHSVFPRSGMANRFFAANDPTESSECRACCG